MIAPITKPVSRVVTGKLVVTLTREGVYLRERGRRRAYGPIPYGILFLQAAREYADGVRAARRKKPRRVRRGHLTVGVR
jgi:hypothetical protein